MSYRPSQQHRLSELIPWLLRRLHVRAQVSVPVTYTVLTSAKQKGRQEWHQGLRGLPERVSLALIKKKIKFSSYIGKFRAVAKSYMRMGFLIYEEMRKYFPIYEEAVGHIWLCNNSPLNFPIYEENLNFFFYQCGTMVRLATLCPPSSTSISGPTSRQPPLLSAA